MKRFLALLLLLTLLPVLPGLAEEEIDVPAVILGDTWVTDNFSMSFSADGSGVLTSNGVTHEGTWEYVNGLVYFRYQQYGDQTLKLTMKKNDGVCQLSCSYFTLRMKADADRIKQEAEETAKKKTVVLKWGDEITLDFISFSLENAVVLRSLEQMIENTPWTFSPTKGKKYLVVYGTVKNLQNVSIWINNAFAEVTLDGKDTYKMYMYAFHQGDTYINSTLNQDATARLLLSAEIPEAAADSFTTAQVQLNINNFMSSIPQKAYEGDFIFQLGIDESKARSAQKGPARKKVTFTFGKNKSLPSPASYLDVILEDGAEFETMHPSSGKSAKVKHYFFRSRFEGDTLQDTVNAYLNALKGDGLTTKKLTGKKSKYNDENRTFYIIKKGKTEVGWIDLSSSDNYSASIYIVKK